MKLIFSILLSVMIAPLALANKGGDKTSKVHTSSIEFEDGSFALTESQKQTIKEVVDGLPRRGKDLDLGIAAWSDQPYPAGKGELNKEQQDLAQKRVQAVESYLKQDLKFQGSVSGYNMATKANWLAKMFDTEGAEIRSAVSEQAGVSNDVLKDRYAAYRSEGGPSKAAIVITRQE